MDYHLVCAIIAVGLTALRYGIYFYTIYKGETKPHAFTWLLFGIVTSLGTWAQLELNAGPSVWALGFVAATCLLIAVLAFFIGERDYARSDWAALFACSLAIIGWQTTGNPVVALVIVIIIDGLSYWPMVRKSFHKPQTEPPLSYGIAGLRYFFMLFAVPEPTWENLLYPFFLMATDWAFAVYIVIRRAKLGHPLHEYAAKKAKLSPSERSPGNL